LDKQGFSRAFQDRFVDEKLKVTQELILHRYLARSAAIEAGKVSFKEKPQRSLDHWGFLRESHYQQSGIPPAFNLLFTVKTRAGYRIGLKLYHDHSE